MAFDASREGSHTSGGMDNDFKCALISSNLQTYVRILEDNDILNFTTAILLTESDLKEMNFSIGARKLFLKMIETNSKNNNNSNKNDTSNNGTNDANNQSIKTQEIYMQCLSQIEFESLKIGDIVDFDFNSTWMKSIIVESGLTKAQPYPMIKCHYVHPLGSFVANSSDVMMKQIPISYKESRLKFAKQNAFSDAVNTILLTEKHLKLVTKGSDITVKDVNGINNWEPCLVLDRKDDKIYIRYKNWGREYNEWIDIKLFISNKLIALPYNLHVLP